jgi:hypothetical protein
MSEFELTEVQTNSGFSSESESQTTDSPRWCVLPPCRPLRLRPTRRPDQRPSVPAAAVLVLSMLSPPAVVAVAVCCPSAAGCSETALGFGSHRRLWSRRCCLAAESARAAVTVAVRHRQSKMALSGLGLGVAAARHLETALGFRNRRRPGFGSRRRPPLGDGATV